MPLQADGRCLDGLRADCLGAVLPALLQAGFDPSTADSKGRTAEQLLAASLRDDAHQLYSRQAVKALRRAGRERDAAALQRMRKAIQRALAACRQWKNKGQTAPPAATAAGGAPPQPVAAAAAAAAAAAGAKRGAAESPPSMKLLAAGGGGGCGCGSPAAPDAPRKRARTAAAAATAAAAEEEEEALGEGQWAPGAATRSRDASERGPQASASAASALELDDITGSDHDSDATVGSTMDSCIEAAQEGHSVSHPPLLALLPPAQPPPLPQQLALQPQQLIPTLPEMLSLGMPVTQLPYEDVNEMCKDRAMFTARPDTLRQLLQSEMIRPVPCAGGRLWASIAPAAAAAWTDAWARQAAAGAVAAAEATARDAPPEMDAMGGPRYPQTPAEVAGATAKLYPSGFEPVWQSKPPTAAELEDANQATHGFGVRYRAEPRQRV
ncbi:hypothetical protein HYH02_006988 [Chlamydomonas schloesseri]|uniref:Uncharacterized protein n=1 Tax=Chlamydomonas schloesseri TaxID=2026947 RepID=A0A835WHZ7_9CHLO|nr:hypothetical protein HYH02_006988 [Chlamydomonas schloesseri]|eukprot:KAG2447959.1 hypothetical protein HYH02_006988 [Chlamydomonas schloesseri]